MCIRKKKNLKGFMY